VLRQRVITGACLAALTVWAVLGLPTAYLGVVFLLVVGAAAWEWGALLALGTGGRLMYLSLVLLLIGVAWWLREQPVLLWGLLLIGGGYWCYVVVWLKRYTARPGRRDPWSVWTAAGIPLLVNTWFALVFLHGAQQFGPGYVLFLLALVWLADSAAYFAGRRWGRHKLAPSISPGKTREGALGALLLALVFSLLGAWLLGFQPWPVFVLVSMGASVFSIIGDLFESMAKRQHGIKDSGSILPGHGGVLDRIDSLTAAAPMFLLGLLVLSL